MGSTDNMFRRVQQLNSGRGAVITAWLRDWRVKALVLGFGTSAGEQGRTDWAGLKWAELGKPSPRPWLGRAELGSSKTG